MEFQWQNYGLGGYEMSLDYSFKIFVIAHSLD